MVLTEESAAGRKRRAAAPKSMKEEEEMSEEEEEPKKKRAKKPRGRAARTSKKDQPVTTKDILEKGRIFFFYRPKVGAEEVTSENDIQRSYIELAPDHGGKLRLLLLPRKHLPDVTSHAPGRKPMSWLFVDMVADKQEEINEHLQGQQYQTKTRGERQLHSARCVGEGVYELVMHNGHAHLAYVLTAPEEPGEVQSELNIAKEASFVVQVRNPENPPPLHHVMSQRFPQGFRGLGEKEHAEYSHKLQAEFDSRITDEQQRRFASSKQLPVMLDTRHTELLFIAATDDICSELGEAAQQLEREAHKVEDKAARAHMDPQQQVRKDLHLKGSPGAPHAKGAGEPIVTDPVVSKTFE